MLQRTATSKAQAKKMAAAVSTVGNSQLRPVVSGPVRNAVAARRASLAHLVSQVERTAVAVKATVTGVDGTEVTTNPLPVVFISAEVCSGVWEPFET